MRGSICGSESLTTQPCVAIVRRRCRTPRRRCLDPTHSSLTRQKHSSNQPTMHRQLLPRPIARTPLCLDDPLSPLSSPSHRPRHSTDFFPFPTCPLLCDGHLHIQVLALGLSVTTGSTSVTVPVEPVSAFPSALRVRPIRTVVRSCGHPISLTFG